MKIRTVFFLIIYFLISSSLVEADYCAFRVSQKKKIEQFLIEIDKHCETEFNGPPLEFKCKNPKAENPVLMVFTKSTCSGSNSFRYLYQISKVVSKKWFHLFKSKRIEFVNVDGKVCFYADSERGVLKKTEIKL